MYLHQGPTSVQGQKRKKRLIWYGLLRHNLHQQVYSIMKKYWFLLSNDTVLTNCITESPSITYRRSRSIRDALVSSHFENTDNMTRDKPQISTFLCGNCAYCVHLDIRTRVVLPGSSVWQAKYRIDCYTKRHYLSDSLSMRSLLCGQDQS